MVVSMRYVDWSAGTSTVAKASVLGFGCSALLGRAGRSESVTALSAALDAGINFFDTARSYGYGDSEAFLGTFLQGRRQEVVLCTKFGIVPAPRTGLKHKLKPLAQAAVRMFPGLRAVARKQAAGQSVAGQFSVQVLRDSFDTSLRELKTDYVDMLLLHAAPADVLDQDDLLDAMGRLVESGKVRMAGISGDQPTIEETFRRRPAVLTSAQFAVNRTNLEFTRQTSQPAAQTMFLVANHPFGGPAGVASTAARVAAMRANEALPVGLREKLDLRDPQLMPEIILNAILSGTGISAVVPAMMKPEHLRSNVQAIDSCRFSVDEIRLLREDLIQNP